MPIEEVPTAECSGFRQAPQAARSKHAIALPLRGGGPVTTFLKVNRPLLLHCGNPKAFDIPSNLLPGTPSSAPCPTPAHVEGKEQSPRFQA